MNCDRNVSDQCSSLLIVQFFMCERIHCTEIQCPSFLKGVYIIQDNNYYQPPILAVYLV